VKRTTGTGPAARVEGSLEVHEGISTETINANTIQSVETLKTDNAEGLVVTSTAESPEHTLKVKGKTYITDELTIEGATTVKDTLTAEKLIISKIDESGKEKGEIITPTLRVNRLTNNSGSIIVDDKNLVVTKSLEVLAKEAIDGEDQNTAAVATIDKAVIGDLIVKKNDTNLTQSTGKITANEMWLESADKTSTGQVPALELFHSNADDAYQLRFKFVPITEE
jgi:hypothetical protein